MQMNPTTVEFLTQHRVCVIATIMSDGMPHVAVTHYAMMDSPMKLFFCIDDRSTTSRSVRLNSRMAAVIGWSEDIPTTVQMHGEANIVTNPSDLTFIKAVYYTRYPHSQQYESDPHTVFLSFSPYWYRFLDPSVDPSLVDFFKRGLPG